MRVARRWVMVLLGLAVAVGGCGTRAEPPPTAKPPTAKPPTSASGRTTSSGWTLTVYYTAVESLHDGPDTRVRGCPRLDCSNGDDDLGAFPADFVDAVRQEGTGRTVTGRYLNWSEDTGYWLDDAPRDTAGRPLRAFESAAADADVLPPGATFTILDCGTLEEGGPAPAAVCARLRAARWRITDAFSTGLGGAGHLDLYIGEERGPRFTETDWYTTLTGARLAVGGTGRD